MPVGVFPRGCCIPPPPDSGSRYFCIRGGSRLRNTPCALMQKMGNRLFLLICGGWFTGSTPVSQMSHRLDSEQQKGTLPHYPSTSRLHYRSQASRSIERSPQSLTKLTSVISKFDHDANLRKPKMAIRGPPRQAASLLRAQLPHFGTA